MKQIKKMSKRKQLVCEGDGKCLERNMSSGEYQAVSLCRHECVPVKCPNYVVCCKVAPQWYFKSRCGLCQVCLDTFGCKLTLKRNGSTGKNEMEDCPVCYETPEQFVEFPTDCGHFFCGKCSANILFYDETRYHISPVPFGCPTCPNGCENPKRGRQCYCAEYDEIIEDWISNEPADADRWQNAELDSIENTEDMAYGSKKCPLCRKKIF